MADLGAVLEVLRSHEDAELQAWGCAALRNLTEEGRELRGKALKGGAFERLGATSHEEATRLVLKALEEHEAAQVQDMGSTSNT